MVPIWAQRRPRGMAAVRSQDVLSSRLTERLGKMNSAVVQNSEPGLCNALQVLNFPPQPCSNLSENVAQKLSLTAGTPDISEFSAQMV